MRRDNIIPFPRGLNQLAKAAPAAPAAPPKNIPLCPACNAPATFSSAARMIQCSSCEYHLALTPLETQLIARAILGLIDFDLLDFTLAEYLSRINRVASIVSTAPGCNPQRAKKAKGATARHDK